MWRRLFPLFFLAMLVAQSAFAFERPFPRNAQRGKMTPAAYPMIVIEGKNRQLAPGARIWNQNNLIEMPASLRGSDLVVNYTEDKQGEIDRIWILTADEIRVPIHQQTNTKPQ